MVINRKGRIWNRGKVTDSHPCRINGTSLGPTYDDKRVILVVQVTQGSQTIIGKEIQAELTIEQIKKMPIDFCIELYRELVKCKVDRMSQATEPKNNNGTQMSESEKELVAARLILADVLESAPDQLGGRCDDLRKVHDKLAALIEQQHQSA